MDFAARFDKGLTYSAFLDRYGTDDHRRRWQAMYDQVALSEAQKDLIGSWVRQMNVLVVAGAWCGDCVNQCPIFSRIEEANPVVRVRYFDRDKDNDLAQELSICGAPRAPPAFPERLLCRKPSPASASMRAAPIHADQAAMKAMLPIVSNAYALSSRPRNVSPRKTVCTSAASFASPGAASDLAESCAYVWPPVISWMWTAMK